MLSVFFLHKNFMIVILVSLFCSIICQIVMGVIYHRLIWEAEHMSTTTNKSLQQLKLKYSGCCKMNEKVSNVSVFVDKYMNRIKFRGVSISILKHLAGQLMLLAVLVAGIGACLGIVRDENFFEIAPFYVISFLGLYGYFATASLVDIPGKINILRINLVDYLENHMANRLEQAALDMRMIQPDEKDSTETHNLEPTLDKQDLDKQISSSFSREEIEELELLLQELF